MRLRNLFVFVAIVVVSVSGLMAAPMNQPNSDQPATHHTIGLNMSHYTYTTYWYYRTSYSMAGESHYPVHIHRRVQATGFWEIKPLVVGQFQFTLRPEVHLGFTGSASEDWLSNDQKVSSGGSILGGGGLIKASIPFASKSKKTVFKPFFACGPQYVTVSSNGEGIESLIASSTEYQYSEGWDEYLFFFTISTGTDIRFGNMIVGLEGRWDLFGSSSTDWTPEGREPIPDGQKLFGLSVGLGWAIL